LHRRCRASPCPTYPPKISLVAAAEVASAITKHRVAVARPILGKARAASVGGFFHFLPAKRHRAGLPSLAKRNGPSSGGKLRPEVTGRNAAYRHDSDVGSQSAVPIKFCFRIQEWRPLSTATAPDCLRWCAARPYRRNYAGKENGLSLGGAEANGLLKCAGSNRHDFGSRQTAPSLQRGARDGAAGDGMQSHLTGEIALPPAHAY
jgi:hypothetical protein